MEQQRLFDDARTTFGLTGRSPQIKRVLRTIEKLSRNTCPILITGESGVGKELVARAVHATSPLAAKIFLPVNASSLSETLVESELFGHVKGAFTGATDARIGLVQAADGGTLFLDEIGDLPSGVQARLLRLLQEQEVRPVGATRPFRVRVRILAATNRDLRAAVEHGTFRRDLYHRLNVIEVSVPPLRDRKQDIPSLAQHFLKKYGRPHTTLSSGLMSWLLNYPWPGNIRELENAIQYMLALFSDGILDVGNLPSNLHSHRSDHHDTPPANSSTPLSLRELERRHILDVIKHTQGDLTAAAHILGIGKTTLYRRLKSYSRSKKPAASAMLPHARAAGA